VHVAVVGASSNRVCVTCPTVATVYDVSVPVTDVGASSNRACATCPTVATDEARLLLLGHHNSDGIATVGRLPVTTEGYRPLLQRRIVVVEASNAVTNETSGSTVDTSLFPVAF
jgi:hypothetical protein